MPRVLVSRWYGTYVVDGGRLVRSMPFPTDLPAIRVRLRARRLGGLAPEESASGEVGSDGPLSTRDRRLAGVHAAAFRRVDGPGTPPPPEALRGRWRELLLEEADEALRVAWDPSIHVEEAVRSMTDLDATVNLLGERLTSWVSRDAPVLEDATEGSVRSIAERLLGGADGPAGALPGADPELAASRREVARLYLETLRTRAAVEQSILGALPRKAPNLSALLGPLLAARMLAQAGGLARMARMPASTIQVLGAERAFFEHLRGRAPPPRHGLLFLHPDLHSAPRKARGKLARALAGKVAIAARIDLQGAPLRGDLEESFHHRRDAIRALGKAKEGRRRPVASGSPLDGATPDR